MELIIFDVDGTLVATRSGATFRKSADDWEWLPGRLEKLQELRSQKMKLALATNQGGVAFGYMQQEDILQELMRMARDAHMVTGCLYVCYTHPKASIDRYRAEDQHRKPGPGMLLDAMVDFEASPDETLMVGDRKEDEQAAKNAGTDFMWDYEFFAED